MKISFPLALHIFFSSSSVQVNAFVNHHLKASTRYSSTNLSYLSGYGGEDDACIVLNLEPETLDMLKIKNAYRKMAKKFHPDLISDASEDEKLRANEQFAKINAAYEYLTENAEKLLEKKKQREQQAAYNQQFGHHNGNSIGQYTQSLRKEEFPTNANNDGKYKATTNPSKRQYVQMDSCEVSQQLRTPKAQEYPNTSFPTRTPNVGTSAAKRQYVNIGSSEVNQNLRNKEQQPVTARPATYSKADQAYKRRQYVKMDTCEVPQQLRTTKEANNNSVPSNSTPHKRSGTRPYKVGSMEVSQTLRTEPVQTSTTGTTVDQAKVAKRMESNGEFTQGDEVVIIEGEYAGISGVIDAVYPGMVKIDIDTDMSTFIETEYIKHNREDEEDEEEEDAGFTSTPSFLTTRTTTVTETVASTAFDASKNKEE